MQLRKTCSSFAYLFIRTSHLTSAVLIYDRLEAMAHPRCVGWGEIGLDYHYDNSPRDVQQSIFIRQLRNAVKLRKPITIHTREAEEDTERILKEEVPEDHRVQMVLSVSFYRFLTFLPPLIDPHSLLHRLARACSTATKPFPKPLYWYNR
jgi:Tat protein secretion system quality control protein TatD with DNase activity